MQERSFISSAGAASTRFDDWAKVKRPEDLSPAMAQQIAELLVHHEERWHESLRRDAPRVLFVGAGCLPFGALVWSWWNPVFALLGGAMMLGVLIRVLQRQSPHREMRRFLATQGTGSLGRDRIQRRVMEVFGGLPPLRPEKRVPVETLVAALAPASGQAPVDRIEQLPQPQIAAAIAAYRSGLGRKVVALGLLATGATLAYCDRESGWEIERFSLLWGFLLLLGAGLLVWAQKEQFAGLRGAGLGFWERRRAAKRIRRALRWRRSGPALPKGEAERLQFLAAELHRALQDERERAGAGGTVPR